MKKASFILVFLLFSAFFWMLSVLPPVSLASPRSAALWSPYLSFSIENVDTAMGVIPVGWPVNRGAAIVSSEFGRRKHPIYKIARQHNGIDFAVSKGNPVYATAEGTVIFAGTLIHYGDIVKIWHEGDFHTFYAHNSKLFVKTGDKVRRGELIAYSGNTGLTTGPHLHYEVRKRGVPQNPRFYLN